jgi:hypothetical protein
VRDLLEERPAALQHIPRTVAAALPSLSFACGFAKNLVPAGLLVPAAYPPPPAAGAPAAAADAVWSRAALALNPEAGHHVTAEYSYAGDGSLRMVIQRDANDPAVPF